MIRQIIFLILLSYTSSVFALVVEPYYGMRVQKYESSGRSGSNYSDFISYYGVQVGKSIKGSVIGVEVGFQTLFKQYGVYGTYMLGPKAKIMARYSPYYKSGTDYSYSTGSVFGVTFGYRLIKRLFLQFELFNISPKTYYSGGTSRDSYNSSYSLYGISISLPLNL